MHDNYVFKWEGLGDLSDTGGNEKMTLKLNGKLS